MNDIPELLMEAFEDAPEYIQSYIQSGKFESFIMELQQKYNLHVDDAGVLSNESLMMLLGFSDPTEFMTNLRESPGLAEHATEIVEDLNRGIFMPLRDEAREVGADTKIRTERKPAPAQVPVMGVGAPDTSGAPSAPTTSAPADISLSPAPTPTAPDTEAPAPAPALEPIQPAPPQPSFAAVPDVPPAQPQYATPYAPAPQEGPAFPPARTMAGDMEMLAQGIQGTPVSPARSFQTASVPVTQSRPSEPRLSTPPLGTPPAQTPPSPSPRPLPPTPSPHHMPNPQPRGLGGDPYREPIE